MSSWNGPHGPQMPTHKCGVNLPGGGTCTADVRYGHLFDPAHWRLVPKDLQREVTRSWDNGAGALTGRHTEACAAARDAVEQALFAAAARPRPHRH